MELSIFCNASPTWVFIWLDLVVRIVRDLNEAWDSLSINISPLSSTVNFTKLTFLVKIHLIGSTALFRVVSTIGFISQSFLKDNFLYGFLSHLSLWRFRLELIVLSQFKHLLCLSRVWNFKSHSLEYYNSQISQINIVQPFSFW